MRLSFGKCCSWGAVRSHGRAHECDASGGGYGGMLRLILGGKTATGAAASEIKGAADTCRIAGVHQPLKDVEGIALVQRMHGLETNQRS